MNYKRFLVNSLLDKYERSLHSQGSGLSNRRVLLRTKELPEYDVRNLEIRDSFNHAVIELEKQQIVLFKWLHGRKGFIIEEVWLNLEQVENAYLSIERESIEVQIKRYTDMFQTIIEQCRVEWITLFFGNQISILQSKKRLTPLCKYGSNAIKDLITAFLEYDKLQGGNMTMRAFSIQCFNDSKYFEQNVKELFLLIASKNQPTLIEALEEDELSWREQFALLGIFARCELYELSGKITIHTSLGNCDFYPMLRCGIAVPSTAINEIEHIDMRNIKSIIFIENKTCYDEYLIKRKRSDELVLFHGGFVSPKRENLFKRLLTIPLLIHNFFFGETSIWGAFECLHSFPFMFLLSFRGIWELKR